MLRRTFVHVPGVGPTTEWRLWRAGVDDWEGFLASADRVRLNPQVVERISGHLLLSQERLRAGDCAFFRDCLPRQVWWRAYRDFPEQTGYLDIETTGMGDSAEVTVVGLYAGGGMQVFVKDENMAELPATLRQCGLLVTYYGSVFDLPVLRRRFPDLTLQPLHLDLCFLLRRLGLSGGLKAVEQRVGIERSEHTRGLSGFDAVRLWRECERGSREARQLLLDYNREDVIHLPQLAQVAYAGLWSKCLEEFAAWQKRNAEKAARRAGGATGAGRTPGEATELHRQRGAPQPRR